MDEESELNIRWISLGETSRQIYALPPTVPWPEAAPPPAPDDDFINLEILAVACGALIGSPRAEEWGATGGFANLCNAAAELMEGFEYSKALELLKEAEDSHPCAFIHWQRCICHLEMQQPEQALAAAHHASSDAPKCAVFWRVFGELCAECKLPKEAEDAFQKAFFRGEHSPSVVRAMQESGLLVPSPAGSADVLVSPHVARSILKTHMAAVLGRPKSSERLRELAQKALRHPSTADLAVFATGRVIDESQTPSDRLLHTEAVWRSGDKDRGKDLLVGFLSENRELPAEAKFIEMTKNVAPEHLAQVEAMMTKSGKMTKSLVEEIVTGSDLGVLEEFAAKHSSPAAWILLGEAYLKDHKKKHATGAALKAFEIDPSPETAVETSKILLVTKEFEKVCAILSKLPRAAIAGVGKSLFGEALWKMGFPDLAAPLFKEAGTESTDDSLVQHLKMREAQCDGDLRPLSESVSLSPTKRLGRPLIIASNVWSSVVAPAGFPSSSYIRVKIDRVMGPSSYRVFEFSRSSGEIEIGTFSPKTKHDALSLAIEPTGHIYVGASFRGGWVDRSKSR